MEFKDTSYQKSERIATITYNRPEKMNAWTPRMQEELIAAFDRADADDDVRAVVVTGAGRGFCAGADLERGGATFDRGEREFSDEAAGAVPLGAERGVRRWAGVSAGAA